MTNAFVGRNRFYEGRFTVLVDFIRMELKLLLHLNYNHKTNNHENFSFNRHLFYY